MIDETRKMLLYWPFSRLMSVHLSKDPSGIPQGFREIGYETVLIVGKNCSDKVSPFKIFESSVSEWKDFFHYYKEYLMVMQYLIKEKPDLLIAYNRGPLLPVIIFSYRLSTLIFRRKRSKNTKFLLKMDSDGNFSHYSRPLRVLILAILWFNSLLFDRVMIESSCGEQNIAKYVRNKGKIVVIPNSHAFRSVKTLDFIHMEREPIILSVARISREKGLEILIEAFSKIYPEFSNWKINIVGPVDEESYFYELKNLTRKLGIENNVIFLGEKKWEELTSIYSKASIFALLSLKESFGIARLEAMVYGLPVVTSEAGCGAEFKTYGSFVVPIGDIDCTSKALVSLISNRELREDIGKRQISGIKSWAEIAKMMCDLV